MYIGIFSVRGDHIKGRDEYAYLGYDAREGKCLQSRAYTGRGCETSEMLGTMIKLVRNRARFWPDAVFKRLRNRVDFFGLVWNGNKAEPQ